LIDREEQDLDIALREHQLSHYGICPKCSAPIDRDFIVCPICNTQVRNVCPTCHRPLNADWKVCPYCRTRIQ
ncbi:MAG: zinc ribbon domain-containing protein, partial [Atopobium sp.]|nr:zinc ribbon domain-containing protein [Atopobium sp.]